MKNIASFNHFIQSKAFDKYRFIYMDSQPTFNKQESGRRSSERERERKKESVNTE